MTRRSGEGVGLATASGPPIGGQPCPSVRPATRARSVAVRTSPPLATFDQFVQMLVLLGVGSDGVPLWSAAVQQLRRAPGPRPVSAAAPYRGRAAYQAEDAEVFFGREDRTERLLGEVGSGRSTPLVVLGVSGSGKSSLLRAVLVARLRAGGERAVVMTPVADPLSALSEARGAVEGPGHATLVVDQFEEDFTVGSQGGGRRAPRGARRRRGAGTCSAHLAAHVGVAPSRYRVAFALRTGSGTPGRST